MAKDSFPAAVIEVRGWKDDTEQYELLKILANENSPYRDELIKVWKTLEKHEFCKHESTIYGFRCHWVYRILERVSLAQKMPPYFYISAKERTALKNDIERLSNELVKKYKAYGLDTNLFFSQSRIFGNWHIYEDYSDANKQRIDQENPDKILTSRIIEFLAERAVDKIEDSKIKGKASKNVKAISFARNLYDANKEKYGQPLNEVISIITNSLFQTNYNESD